MKDFIDTLLNRVYTTTREFIISKEFDRVWKELVAAIKQAEKEARNGGTQGV